MSLEMLSFDFEKSSSETVNVDSSVEYFFIKMTPT